MPNHSRINRFLFLFIVIGLVGCLEKEEGCLDPNALNLDVSADVNANCDYPSIRFNVSHRWIRPANQEDDTTTFRLNSIFNVPATDDSVIFSSIRFYMSNVKLGGSEPLIVSDSILLNDGGYVANDLMLFNAANFQFATGDINRYGNYSGLEFDVGYGERWPEVDTTFLEDKNGNHVWLSSVMRDDTDERYSCKMSYTLYGAWNGTIRDTTLRTVGLISLDLFQIRKTGNFTVNQANHADVGLLIDYRRLIDGIDLRQADSIAMKTLIMQNMNEAIDVVQ